MANGAWQVRLLRATKLRTMKIDSGGQVLLFTKFAPTKLDYPLYGTNTSIRIISLKNKAATWKIIPVSELFLVTGSFLSDIFACIQSTYIIKTYY